MNRSLRRVFWSVLGAAVAFLSGGAAAFGQCACPSDMNNDQKGDSADIQCFIRCLTTGAGGACPSCGCADTNLDTLVNLNDVAQFVSTILNKNLVCTTSTPCYEPGPWETPPASPCAERKSCGRRADEGVAESVYFAQGEFHHTAVDLRIKGRGLDFVWARKYRSKCGPNTAIGNSWDFSYNIYIEAFGQHLIVHDGNSRSDLYLLQPNGRWASDGFFRELQQNGDGTYSLIFADTGRWNFRPLDGTPRAGKILSIVDRNSNQLNFTHQPATGRLITISDTLNRQINIAYNADGRVSTVTDFEGRQVVYTYYTDPEIGGSLNDLKSVRSPLVQLPAPNDHNNFPSGKTTVYTYSEGFLLPTQNSNLLTITDPKGQVYLANTYHPTTNAGDLNFDRITRQVWGCQSAQAPDCLAGPDIIDMVYVPLAAGPANNNAILKAIVNDRVGNVKEYFYDSLNRLVMAHEYTGRANPDQPTTDAVNRPANPVRPGVPPVGPADPARYETRWNHNADSLPTMVTHPNGNTTVNTYELALNPAADRRARGNLRQVLRNPGPLGGDQATIVESFTYESGFGGCCGTNFVALHQDPNGFVTLHSYDFRGNRLRTTHRPGGGVEDWSYNFAGQVETHTLPANGNGHRRVDLFEYYGIGDGAQNGYLKSVTVDSGNLNLKTSYTYDARGNVVTLTHPRGNAAPPTAGQDTILVYNELDQVVYEQSRAVIPGGAVRYDTRTWYDADDNVVRVDRQNVDGMGAADPNAYLTTIHEYEILNRVIRTCQERGAAAPTPAQLTCASLPLAERITTEYGYDANRNQTLVEHPQAQAAVDPQPNHTTHTEYDERDRVFRAIRAKNDAAKKSTTQTSYDGNGNVARTYTGIETDTNHLTTDTYDGYDRLKTSTDAVGTVTTYTYDASGNRLMKQVNGDRGPPAGVGLLYRVMHSYDAMDRPTRQGVAHFNVQTGANIGDGESLTQTTYANNSQVTSRTDDLGNVTQTSYDTANRQGVITDAKGNTTTYSYDANDNVLTVVEVEKSDLLNPDQAFTTTYAYDGLDRRITAMDNAGNVTMQSYDSRDNVALARDAVGTRTSFSYDGADRQTRQSIDLNNNGLFNDVIDIILMQSWDDDGRITGQVDDNGQETAPQYDELDRVTAVDMADCTMPTRDYNAHGNLTTETKADGSVITYAHDALDRLTGRAITPGAGVSADTTFETFAHDGMGRIVSAQNDLSTVARTYDSLGNVLTDRQTAVGIGTPRTVTCSYDGMGNKLTIADSGGRIVAATYDALNRKKTITDNLIGNVAAYDYVGPSRVERRTCRPGDPTEVVCDYEYDSARRITRTHHSSVLHGDIDDRTYGWDANDNKTSRADVRPGGPLLAHAYVVDRAERLRTTTVTDGALGGTLRLTNTTLDGAGNRSLATGSMDGGTYTEQTTCPVADFEMNQYTVVPMGGRVYDDEGNLRVVNQGLPNECGVTYDYANRMVSCLNVSTGQTHIYRYDALGRRIVRWLDTGDPATLSRYIYDGWQEVLQTAGLGGTGASFVYGNYVDEVLTSQRAGVDSWYHADDLHNVMALTDSTGAVVERYEYHDYGKPLISVHAQPPNLLGAHDANVNVNPYSGIPIQELAEDFMFAQDTVVTSLRWWGGYDYAGGPPGPVDNFTIRIYDDAGGLPGSVLYTEQTTGYRNRTNTGRALPCMVCPQAEYAYEFALGIPFPAQAGVTYWLSIANDTSAFGGPVKIWRWEEGPQFSSFSAISQNSGPWSTGIIPGLAFELFTDRSAVGNPLMFNGRRYDPETGWYYYRTRYHDPRGGRFTTRDTIGTWGDTTALGNAYAYLAGHPFSRIDPLGLKARKLIVGVSCWCQFTCDGKTRQKRADVEVGSILADDVRILGLGRRGINERAGLEITANILEVILAQATGGKQAVWDLHTTKACRKAVANLSFNNFADRCERAAKGAAAGGNFTGVNQNNRRGEWKMGSTFVPLIGSNVRADGTCEAKYYEETK